MKKLFVLWDMHKACQCGKPMTWREACACAKDHHVVVPA